MNDLKQWTGQVVPTNQEVLLVHLLIDDSGSIHECRNTNAVIEGYNGFLDNLVEAPGEVLLRTSFLNAKSPEVFCAPKDAPKLSLETYRPAGNTPLFKRSVEVLRSVVLNAKELAQQGKTVRTITLIFTDGGDSRTSATAGDVKSIVDVMLTTGTHIVGACGISDGVTNFWQVFASMGIPENWIKVLENDQKAVSQSIRDFGTMSSQASMSGDSFAHTSRTGFSK